MSRLQNIAIIAVHGVGPHEPHASAQDVANLLLRVPRDRSPDYTSFQETSIELPTRRLAVSGAPAPDEERSEWLRYSERSAHPRVQPDPHGPDHLLMHRQLAGYCPEEQDGLYETIRIETQHLRVNPSAPGARAARDQHAIDQAQHQGAASRDSGDGSTDTLAPNIDANIHVYEMYWSDLSRIGNTFLSIFGAFYQLVIHLPYLGRSTLEFARASSKAPRWAWVCLAGAHTTAMRALTLFVPTINMVMFALATSLLVHYVPANAALPVARGMLTAAALVLATLALYRASPRWPWPALALVAAAAALVWYGSGYVLRMHPRAALVYEWWALTALPLYGVFTLFQKNRPGARPVSVVLYAATTLFLLRYTVGARDSATGIVFPVLELQSFALQLSWIVFGFALLLVVVFGLLLPRLPSVPNSAGPEGRAAHLQATYTARFALGLPAVAFSVATLLVWAVLVGAEARTALSNEPAYTPIFEYPSLDAQLRRDSARVASSSAPARGDATRSCVTVVDSGAARLRCAPAYFIRAFPSTLDTPYGLASAGLVLLALLMVILLLGPVVVAEWRSPRSPPDRTERGRFRARSLRLGAWLDSGFGAARHAGELLCAAPLVALLSLLVVAPVIHRLVPTWLVPASLAVGGPFGDGLVSYGKLLVGTSASTVGILLVIHRLSDVGLGLRPALGIAVDVDNYLRELPRERTPRARMAERYTSLLRYICDWRSDSADPNSGYDAVIIVAHSQGTVITTDLLRFLEQEAAGGTCEPRLARLAGHERPLPIALFTMGCPLRQLYAQRFPHLYGWVTRPTGSDLTLRPPSPASMLGVRLWFNAYRSADYVGRSLWISDPNDSSTYVPFEPRSPSPAADEMCIGPGAHIHYWDETADVIGDWLDRLVRMIISGRPFSASVLSPAVPPVVTH